MSGATDHVLPVVMAGGSGTRLWPLSRALYPKQFLALAGAQTLFQQATLRLMALAGASITVEPPCVVANEEHRFMATDQLREVGIVPGALLLEPTGRNTAPALTLAALLAESDAAARDPILVVTASDHTVADLDAFDAALRSAVTAASDGAIVVLGITPTRPETAFGYVRVQGPSNAGHFQVARFVEKPDAPTAAAYVADGGYYWNSGMFVVRASVWLRALKRYRPDIEAATRAAWSARRADASFVRPDKTAFEAIPSESIDYAVMEPATAPDSPFEVRMVALDAGWSDLGSWDAVWSASALDTDGNATHGDVLLEDTRNTYVHSTSRLVSTIGLDNLVIVETPDAVLVAEQSRSQHVKKLVATLGTRGRGEASTHLRVHRPWGWYESVDQGPRFQVKRIMVKPGAKLSLQMHHHRAEHWIVVSGTAEVTNGEAVVLLSENQSTYIPLGQKHRLANPGQLPLEIIEVQSGSYLGEDDIVRFDDHYGRA